MSQLEAWRRSRTLGWRLWSAGIGVGEVSAHWHSMEATYAQPMKHGGNDTGLLQVSEYTLSVVLTYVYAGTMD